MQTTFYYSVYASPSTCVVGSFPFPIATVSNLQYFPDLPYPGYRTTIAFNNILPGANEECWNGYINITTSHSTYYADGVMNGVFTNYNPVLAGFGKDDTFNQAMITGLSTLYLSADLAFFGNDLALALEAYRIVMPLFNYNSSTSTLTIVETTYMAFLVNMFTSFISVPDISSYLSQTSVTLTRTTTGARGGLSIKFPYIIIGGLCSMLCIVMGLVGCCSKSYLAMKSKEKQEANGFSVILSLPSRKGLTNLGPVELQQFPHNGVANVNPNIAPPAIGSYDEANLPGAPPGTQRVNTWSHLLRFASFFARRKV